MEKFKFPLEYINITQGYHQGKCLDLGWSSKHGGNRVPVYACGKGIVKSVEDQPKGGNVIYIEHDKGIVSCYAHLSKVLVKEGQEVGFFEQIGNMGDTGEVTGPHTHFGLFESFEVRYKDSTLDPFKYCEVYEDQEVDKDTSKEYADKLVYHKDSENSEDSEKLDDLLGTYKVVYDSMYIRVGPSDKSARKKVAYVTKDAQSKCVDKNPKANAALKVGSRFDVLEISKNDSQIWGRTYSGWICLEGKHTYCEKVK